MRPIARFLIFFLLVAGISCDKADVEKPVEKIPEFSGFSPASGGKGTILTLVGKNFGTTAATNSLKINGLSAKILTVKDDAITAEVPAKSGLGFLELTISTKTFKSAEKFRYLYSGTTTFFSGAGPGFANGPAQTALFGTLYIITQDSKGIFYSADLGNCMIRKIEADGFVSTVVGTPHSGFQDGKGEQALLNFPIGVDIGPDGTIYVADTGNNAIRKISADGTITTLTGNPDRPGSVDGNLATASFKGPYGVKMDKTGVLWICDTENSLIRKISADGKVTTFAGSEEGFADGKLFEAKFHYPTQLAFDGAGNIFVTDKHNHCIRKITPDGMVTTLAGKPGNAGFANGSASEAMFNQPCNIQIDKVGNLYVNDLHNHCIRLIYPDGVVATLAGQGTIPGYMEGKGSESIFTYPQGSVFDKDGNLYITDSANQRIRKLTIE